MDGERKKPALYNSADKNNGLRILILWGGGENGLVPGKEAGPKGELIRDGEAEMTGSSSSA